ncbi:uncharacterized protein C4orf19 homolog [Python bivittatus]|uniref:Uncharacterized protein C4orf19 homolog n=1 Tax=Python bivittatus TaxID=176946 RepID=A0A9F3QRE9_PYTBI|nr:uncharacterized protein C4orf19 homolog [Python bivittatus]
MGCKCCKMIKSYIFDPQEVQTAANISEINNYKSDEEERGKFQCQQSSDVQDHKNELQNTETQLAANQPRLNLTRDALWNYRLPALQEKGLGNSVEKCSINGIHFFSGMNLGTSHNKSQFKEINPQICSVPLPDSPGKRVCDKREILDSENHPKQSLETSDTVHREDSQSTAEHILSIQCAISEVQDKDFHLGHPSSLPKANHAEKQRVVGNENLSNHLVQINQSTESTTILHNWNLPCCESDEGDSFWRTGPLSICFKDKISTEILFGGNEGDPAQEARYDGHTKVNGELEEDADVAEALAALEAATEEEEEEEEEEDN